MTKGILKNRKALTKISSMLFSIIAVFIILLLGYNVTGGYSREAYLKIDVTYFSNYGGGADISDGVYVGDSLFGAGHVKIPLTSGGEPIIDFKVSDDVPGLSVLRGEDGDGSYVEISAYGYNQKKSRESIKFEVEFKNSVILDVVNDEGKPNYFGYEKPDKCGCGIDEEELELSDPENDEYDVDVGGTKGSLCSITELSRDRVRIYYGYIECEVNEDCGRDGFVGDGYCSNEDIYQNYREYTCNNPGTPESSCSYEDTSKLKQDCGQDYCGAWGDNYCKDNDVWHKRTCHDRGCSCSEGSCFDESYEEAELVQECDDVCIDGECVGIECYDDEDCGEEELVDRYCEGDEVWEMYFVPVCLNEGTPESECSGFYEERFEETCDYGCSGGFCLPPPGCEDTCESLGFECGIQMICAEEIFCGSCSESYDCRFGICVEEEECEVDEDCDNGLWCDGEETCADNECVPGESVNCSIYNILGIASCNNIPDNNPFTWDYFAGFTSVCDELNDKCSEGTIDLSHNFEIGKCNVECLDNSDCEEDEECEDYVCEGKEEEDREREINYCGDGFCDEYIREDEYTCPEDCFDGVRALSYIRGEAEEVKEGIVDLKGKFVEEKGGKIFLVFLLLILLLLLLVIVIYFVRR